MSRASVAPARRAARLLPSIAPTFALAREAKETQLEESQSPVQGTTFDTMAIAAEMRTEVPYEREGHTARTLVREPDLRVVLVVMKGGSIIKEHRAKATASIHVLDGRVRVRMQDRLVELPSARILVLEGGLPHSVEAIEESAFLLTLAWHDDT